MCGRGWDGIAGTERKGGVWLQRCYLFSAALTKQPLQFLQIRDRFFMGLMGLDVETKWQKLKKITSKGNYSKKKLYLCI